MLGGVAEQHRIAAKVDELMDLCGQLEAQLATTATGSRRLLEAVLRDTLAPAQESAAPNPSSTNPQAPRKP